MRRLALGLILACALGATAVWWELRPSVETRLEDLVGRLIQDADRRDVQAMAPFVSDRYKDERGLDRAAVLEGLARYLQGTREKILPVRVSVDKVDDDRAEVSAKIVLAEAEARPNQRRARDAYEIDLVLGREAGKWRVLSAEDWQIPAEDATMLP